MKTALVTGANAGIGRAVTHGLADLGLRVVMLCRSEKRGTAARTEIAAATGSDRLELLLCDLADLHAVRRAAADVRERYDRLDVLVNNAGLFRGGYETSADGLEMTWVVNHFGPFLLTNELRPLLEATAAEHGEARIVNVSSDAHRGAALGPGAIADVAAQGGPRVGDYGGMQAYAQTKLANILFAREWTQRCGETGVTANAVHPGVVATNIWRGAGGWLAKIANLLTVFFTAPETGAAGPLRLATDPALAGVSGRYFSKTKEKAPAAAARDADAARRLWEASEKVIRGIVDERA